MSTPTPLHAAPRRGTRPGRFIKAAGAVSIVAGLGASGLAAFAPTPTGPNRIAGVDRYATAAAVATTAYASGAKVVYLAAGSDFPDALSAAAVAGGRGPVLFAGQTWLPSSTAAAIAKLHPASIIAVGGTGVLSTGVLNAAHAMAPSATLTRIDGADRYGTAAAISAATFSASKTAWLATGTAWPDALSAAAAAGGTSPVLLLAAGSAPAATASELRRLGATSVHVVGGTSAVSGPLLAAVQAADPAAVVDRIAGGDRYATAIAVSRQAFATGASLAMLATGVAFPDALSAASAASGKGPVLLAAPGALPAATTAEMTRLHPQSIEVVGGTRVISSTAIAQLSSAVTAQAVPPVSSKAGVAVATARAQLGKPYQWAGAGPDSFDCSGLTMFAWAAASVTLPHNSQAQYQLLPAVPIADLQPGDLVFYGTPANVYHVGIYIGAGNMIEAAHTGAPVRIAAIQRPDLLAGGRPT